MTDTPASTPAPDPTPDPAIPTLKPGIYSSEAWLTFLTNVIGLIPASGLVANMPLAAKLVGMAIAALATLNYTAQRTSLKRAHLAASSLANTGLAPATAIPSSALVGKIVTATLALGTVALIGWGCVGNQTPSQAVKTGGDAFLSCEKVNLSQDVNGGSLLSLVANDLVNADYAQAIADLIAKLGGETVGCAVLAVDTVVSAGKTSGAAALTPIEVRAKELIQKYGWKTAPPAPPPVPHAELPAQQHRGGLAMWPDEYREASKTTSATSARMGR